MIFSLRILIVEKRIIKKWEKVEFFRGVNIMIKKYIDCGIVLQDSDVD